MTPLRTELVSDTVFNLSANRLIRKLGLLGKLLDHARVDNHERFKEMIASQLPRVSCAFNECVKELNRMERECSFRALAPATP
jgi:hypothetical protein